MKTIMIQNVDRVVRRSDYNHLSPNELLVTSMFATLQGEGPFAGYPAVFLRLAGCNFGDKKDHCQGCDTFFKFDEAEEWDHDELLDLLVGHASTLGNPATERLLVITGGEPTLQPSLLPFIKKALQSFKWVQLETNGTQAKFFEELRVAHENHEIPRGVARRGEFAQWHGLSIVVSPKASMWASRYPELSERVSDYATCLKFVVSADEEDPHHLIPEWAYKHKAKFGIPLYVSPLAVYSKPYQGEVSSIWEDGLINKEVTSKNYSYAAQLAMNTGCLLSLQTHLFVAIA
jgi:organic radical activating enzyme